jgi:hypothetical protein
MHLFKDGTAYEDIRLYEYKTKPQMHELFEKKGLKKKPQRQIYKEQRIRMAEKELRSMERVQPVYSTMNHLYLAVGFCTVVFAFCVNRRSKNKKRKGTTMTRSNNDGALQKV